MHSLRALQSGIPFRTGTFDLGSVIWEFPSRFGLGIWALGSGFGIQAWDMGSGIPFENQDPGSGFGLRTRIWVWDFFDLGIPSGFEIGNLPNLWEADNNGGACGALPELGNYLWDLGSGFGFRD